MKSVLLSDSDPATVRSGEGLDLDTLDGAEDVAVPTFGVKKFYFSIITFEIEIVDHCKTFQFVKKKTV
jgi:hypothetical protein